MTALVLPFLRRAALLFKALDIPVAPPAAARAASTLGNGSSKPVAMDESADDRPDDRTLHLVNLDWS